uniref:Uncharacterized protein n=1 Tax=Anopheles arabiensis TaxID=7173 RepID=A0A182IF70_ANOAR
MVFLILFVSLKGTKKL